MVELDHSSGAVAGNGATIATTTNLLAPPPPPPPPHSLNPTISYSSESSSSSSTLPSTTSEKGFSPENEKDMPLSCGPPSPLHGGDQEKGGIEEGGRMETLQLEQQQYRQKLEDEEDNGLEGGDKDEFGREISPIPEVAAIVSNTDDPSIPCMTFRFWVMGLISISTLSFVNQFFFFREAPMVLGPLVIQLLSYPVGQFMARILPTREFNVFGFAFSLNPGPFNVKEHVLITVMASCGAGTAYAVDVIVIQRVFYYQDFGFLANLLLILTTQLVGYGMAGILRRYLVYPAAMVWPSNLVMVALFNTLHTRETLAPGQWTRQKFFAVFSVASFCYYWIPAYIFPVVTSLAWLCYINPSNVVLSQLTGSQGLSMGVLSLDWSTITAFLGSPLITPYWAQVNIMLGFVFIAWIMVPVAYYLNVWNSKMYPIMTSQLFTVDGYYYDTLSVLTPQKTLDESVYATYGPLRITTFLAISYGVGFAGLTAIITHTFLYHRKQIWAQWKEARGTSQDVHYKLMQAYQEVPEWWYLSLFALTVGLAIVTCEVWDYGLPWWCVLLAVGISAMFSLPIGLIQAVTNQQPGLNVLSEFVVGYILPGRPIANVTFKTLGYISTVHTMSFLGDLKLGQYMKIPPKAMFMTQLIGTCVAGVINLITANWLLSTRPNICTPEGYPWTCPIGNVFFSASVIWGVIAPERMFGSRSIYHPLMYFFLIGLVIPIPFYLFSRYYPGTIVDKIHTPVLLTSTGMMPPARPYQYANWLAVGFLFQFCAKRYRPEWYQRFNYILSGAMDAGVAIAALVIFFTLQMRNVEFPTWWGTKMNHCPLEKANFYGKIPVNRPKTSLSVQHI